MNIAIIHYHLNRGGVTQVILNHLRALDAVADGSEPVRVALLYGGRCEGLPDGALGEFSSVDVSLHEVAGLDYDEAAERQSESLFETLQQVLRQIEFSPESSLLHIHNHALGKNISLPEVIWRLQKLGYPLLLQIHDFAEDFRPEHYRRLADSYFFDDPPVSLPTLLYRSAPSIHYAVLNRRDYRIFQQAGVDERQLHWLPNTVSQFAQLPDKSDARNKLEEFYGVAADSDYLLYPVRGIRRKNLGEALLWSVLGNNVTVGITLPPINPAEQKSYARWKDLAGELKLPCVFEAGAKLTFEENLAAADRILTTSVAEGFGMVFLEAWLAGRSLVGRNLPEITADFAESGVDLGALGEKLLVPLNWIDENEFRAVLKNTFRSVREAFGSNLELQPERIEAKIDELLYDGNVDFAILSSELQAQVIRMASDSDARRDELLQLNQWVKESLDDQSAAARIARNASAVRAGYSLEVSGKRLMNLYRAILAGPKQGETLALLAGNAILDSFLDITRLHPIRLET